MKVYIASPFFNKEQLDFVKRIESLLEEKEIDYFSPRKHGVTLKDMTPAQREKAASDVFNSNINGMDESDILISVIDDYDPGTIFELGYFFYKKFVTNSVIITVSNKGYGLNVMLSQSADAHAIGIDGLESIMCNIITYGEVKAGKRALTDT